MARGRPAIEPGEWGEISAWKLPNGRWQASVIAVSPLGERKRCRSTRKTRGAAITAVRRRAEAVVRDATTGVGRISSTTTVAELLDAYLEHRRNELSTSSLRIYAHAAETHVKPSIGRLQLRQVTTAVLDAWLHTLTPGNAKTSQALLSGAFSQAQRWGAVETNPVRGTSRPKAIAGAPEALTRDQLDEFRRRVVDYQTGDVAGRARRADPLLRIVDVLAGTGARAGEVLAMQWEDLALDGEPATVTLRGTKTANALRTVQLPPFAVEALRAQRAALGPAADLYPYVWQTGNGTPVSLSSLNRWFRAVAAYWATRNPGAVDELPNVTPRTMRKTVATVIADEVGEYEASRQLGHGDTAVTRRHYLQAPPLGPAVAAVLEDHLMTK